MCLVLINHQHVYRELIKHHASISNMCAVKCYTRRDSDPESFGHFDELKAKLFHSSVDGSKLLILLVPDSLPFAAREEPATAQLEHSLAADELREDVGAEQAAENDKDVTQDLQVLQDRGHPGQPGQSHQRGDANVGEKGQVVLARGLLALPALCGQGSRGEEVEKDGEDDDDRNREDGGDEEAPAVGQEARAVPVAEVEGAVGEAGQQVAQEGDGHDRRRQRHSRRGASGEGDTDAAALVPVRAGADRAPEREVRAEAGEGGPGESGQEEEVSEHSHRRARRRQLHRQHAQLQQHQGQEKAEHQPRRRLAGRRGPQLGEEAVGEEHQEQTRHRRGQADDGDFAQVRGERVVALRHARLHHQTVQTVVQLFSAHQHRTVVSQLHELERDELVRRDVVSRPRGGVDSQGDVRRLGLVRRVEGNLGAPQSLRHRQVEVGSQRRVIVRLDLVVRDVHGVLDDALV